MSNSSVDPELQPILAAFKELWGDTAMDLDDLEGARQTHDAMSAQRNSAADEIEGVNTHREIIRNSDLGVEVVAYVHQPSQASEAPRRAMLHIHGGGYVTGRASHAEPQLRLLAKQFDCLIVSVDYRLAPEHPFPAALYDCFSTLQWLHSRADKLNIDAAKIIVLGESAGGGLAAGLSMYARDHSDIKIAQQILLYPMLDYRNTAALAEGESDTIVWSRQNNIIGWGAYMGEGVDESMLAYASPSYAKDSSGLPPTYACIGDIDLFCQETIDYIELLRDAEVITELDVYPGAYHAFQVVVPDAAVSQTCLKKLDQILAQAFA